MSVFDELFRNVGEPALESLFAETVMYVKSTGESRKILAQVQRQAPTNSEGIITSDVVVTVRNCETRGISSGEVNTGVDTIIVSKRLGTDALPLAILEVVSDAGGTLQLLLR